MKPNHIISMKKCILFFVLFLSFTIISNAQEKVLSIEDATWLNRSIYPSSLGQLQWMGSSDHYAYVKKNCLISGDIRSEKRDTIVRLNDFNNFVPKLISDSLKRFPRVSCLGDNIIMFRNKNKLFLYDISLKELRKINEYDKKAQNIDIDRKTFQLAYTIENNLFVALEGNQIAITKDESKEIVNGQTVHRNEFGISKGTFWSPKGNYLAFYRKDETMVTDYPIVNIDKRIAEVENTKYPMAGMTSHEVTLGVYSISENKTVFLKTGEPKDQYLTNVSWGPNEDFIYIAVLNRGQDHLKLNQYDAKTGEFVKTLFEESNERYVEPEHGLSFLNSKPDQFVWQSERDGFNHLYLYNTEGKLLKQLTKGDWLVANFLGFDKNEKLAFFTATKESPIQKNIYSLNMKNLKITRLSHDHGTHRANLNKNGKYFIDRFSSTDVTREIKIISAKGKELQVLLEDKNPLADYKLGEMSIFTIKNDEGDDLYCQLIKPVDFDSTKKYPVIVYVYGGPHLQLITDSWLGGAGLYNNYLASEGYVIFTLDNRGSANRGFEFESTVHRNLGTLEIDDQMKGIEYLKTLDFVDPERIGVKGWSYGGFMTTLLMLKQPETFKVGVAGGPVVDWNLYEVMYGERYMDTPEENPEGYKNANLLNFTDNLEGDLLLIHGTSDATVVWQHSLSLIKKCIENGVMIDYFVYPGHGHGVRGMDRLHLNKKIKRYFDDHLK